MLRPAIAVFRHHLNDRYERIRFRSALHILHLADVRSLIALPENDEESE